MSKDFSYKFNFAIIHDDNEPFLQKFYSYAYLHKMLIFCDEENDVRGH